MPPKKKFSRDQIIEAAFDIARTEGIDGVTIRKVADRLNSSIAPVYVNFKDVRELKKEIVNKIVKLSYRLLKEEDSGSPFYDIGAASLRFAKEYPVLFQDFITKQNEYLETYNQEMDSELVEHMKRDPDLNGFQDRELSMILLKMRIFTVGLSTMLSNDLLPGNLDEERAMEILYSTGEDLLVSARRKK